MNKLTLILGALLILGGCETVPDGPPPSEVVDLAPADPAIYGFDRDADLLVKVRPSLRFQNLVRSENGTCTMFFDIDETGEVENVRTGPCFRKDFKVPSKRAIYAFKYEPATLNGEPVVRRNARYDFEYQFMGVKEITEIREINRKRRREGLDPLPSPDDEDSSVYEIYETGCKWMCGDF